MVSEGEEGMGWAGQGVACCQRLHKNPLGASCAQACSPAAEGKAGTGQALWACDKGV